MHSHLLTYPYRRARFLLASTLCIATCSLVSAPVAFAQQTPPPGPPPPGPRARQNPFVAPAAKLQNAPEREYDLQHLVVVTNVDYSKHVLNSRTRNVVAPLQAGLTELKFHKGKGVTVSACSLNGKPAMFKIDDEFVRVQSPAPLPAKTPVTVEIVYTGGKIQGTGFGSGADGGVHWLDPTKSAPERTGFWTQGESNYNREWAVTWDYPNDFTTSETITTVPADWSVIGNGSKVSDVVNADGKTRTVRWAMTQPHATYLLSLVAGPMDIKTSQWEGVSLVYTTPKGKGKWIDDSFGDTPDMLAYFSKITGVKYAWPKYAENAVFDFNGGMENVSSTTLTEGGLTDSRSGYRTMASLNSHELAHQWFGDLVTCKNWGETWLNESFATIFQILYFEHSRGKNGYDYEIDGSQGEYLDEARRYKRPIVTNMYSDPDVMFDSGHAYAKGGMVLHTLRRQIGDAAFFAGIKLYLTTNRNNPVETADFIKAMSQTSGTDLKPFADQWLYKPGHPVLDWSYTYDAGAKEVVVTVKQTQDTTDGTPIYTVPAKVGLISGANLVRVPVTLNATEQTFRLPAPVKPDVVIMDPDHDFLREIPKQPWTTEAELAAIVRYAPNGPERQSAMDALLGMNNGKPSEASIAAAVEAAQKDMDRFPALANIDAFGKLKRESLRSFFRTQINHPDQDRAAGAVNALGSLSNNPEDTKVIRGLINDTAPYVVVAAAVRTLTAWDAKGNADVITKAAEMPSRREMIRRVALPALAKADPQAASALALRYAAATNPIEIRAMGISTLGSLGGKEDDATRTVLSNALKEGDVNITLAAARSIGQLGDKSLLPDLKAAQTALPSDTPRFFRGMIDRIVRQLETAN